MDILSAQHRSVFAAGCFTMHLRVCAVLLLITGIASDQTPIRGRLIKNCWAGISESCILCKSQQRMSTMPDEQLPLKDVATHDPGDDTLRRFRYQHAYGVILLLAALRDANDYLAVWCEHHEDFLAERPDGKYEGIQVKTLQDGVWKTNSDAFCHSIGRFAKLSELSKGEVEQFTFVTNANFFETSVADERHLCPRVLIAEVKLCDRLENLNGAKKGVRIIATKTTLSEEIVFTILKKVNTVIGPPLNGFESLIAHEHLSKVERCKNLAAGVLSTIVDRMVSLIYKASSLAVTDPSRHYAPLLSTGAVAADIAAKRVTKDLLSLALEDCLSPSFRYQTGLGILKESTPKTWGILKKKMEYAGVEDFFDLVYRRAISAEAYLFALDPSTDAANQIENLVADQCDEIRLKHAQESQPCGDKILREISERFEQMSRDQPGRVHHQQQEMLVGVAGLLAGDCKVWLSKPFDLEGKP